MLSTFFRRAAVALGLAGLVTGAPAIAKQPQAHPALWEVSDADTTIYLFGTIHLLPANYQWRTAKFDKALADAQQLVVETEVDDKNPAKLMAALVSIGFANDLPPLVDRVSPDKRTALQAAIAKSGTPPSAFNRMKTWTAAFTIMGQQYKNMGLQGGEGVEAVLRRKFTTEGKPIGELETNVQQLGFFDTLPEKAQRDLLESTLDGNGDAQREFSGMLKAWSKGDVQAIAKTFDHDLAASPDLRNALLRRRNANWSKWIEQRMAKPGSLLIAVGAGHLAGDESVIAQLQRDGYKVRRLQ